MTTSTTEPARVGREGLEHNSMVWSNWRRETPRNANKAAHGHTHLARRLHPKRSVCMYTQLVCLERVESGKLGGRSTLLIRRVFRFFKISGTKHKTRNAIQTAHDKVT